MPCLHSASVATRVPSASRIASSKNSGGCCGPDPQAGLIDGVHQVQDIGLTEAAAEVPGGGGIGDPLGAQGVEINLVVATQLEVFDPLSRRPGC